MAHTGVDDVISLSQVREQLKPILLCTLEQVRAVVNDVFSDTFRRTTESGTVSEDAAQSL